MSKTTSLTKRGYSILKSEFSPSQLDSIRKDLTFKPFVKDDYGPPPDEFPIYLESPSKIYLPKHYGFDKFGQPSSIKIPEGVDIDLKFNGALRPHQQEFVNIFIKSCQDGPLTKNSHGGILSAQCAFGKTSSSLFLVSALKKKTLVIVHKEFLLHQWTDRIKQFLPEARVGRFQGSKIDIDDKDIVIGMLQSISLKDDLPEGIFDSFGFVIVDEAHHINAEKFSRALPRVNSKYMLGLSATPIRADGLHKIFFLYLGPIIYKYHPQNADKKVDVRVLHYFNSDPLYSKEEFMGMGKICTARMLNNITAYPRRNQMIIQLLRRLSVLGHNTLVLSDRREQLNWLFKEVEKFTTVGFYVGGMKRTELEASEKCQVILATYQMSSEGMDIPSLNAAIFATPKSAIEQSIGRIVRKVHEKIPIAIDICDEFSTFKYNLRGRVSTYKKLGYPVSHFNIHDYTSDSFDVLDSKVAEIFSTSKKPIIESKEPKETIETVDTGISLDLLDIYSSEF